MSSAKKLMGTTAVGGALAIEDVFSTYLYTGNATARSITNGIDLAGEGGLVWSKSRSSGVGVGDDYHFLFDTERGSDKYIFSNATNAEVTSSLLLTSFNSDGYSIGTRNANNKSGENFASWTFRKAPRFFDCVTWTGTGTPQNISHNLGVTPGCIMIKSTSISGNWWVWHRTLPDARYGLYLSGTSAQTTSNTTLDWTDPTDTVFRVGTSALTNTSGASYVAYLFAHDPLGPSGDGSDGLIACGSYTGNEFTFPIIDLGWEPQWVLIRSTSTRNWHIFDTMRGIATGGEDPYLYPNSNDAESTNGNNYIDVYPTGFGPSSVEPQTNSNGETFIYIAIRRGPMRQPTSGTEVFAIDTIGGTSPTPPTYNSGFPVDFAMQKGTHGTSGFANTRLLSGTQLVIESTAAESAFASSVFDYMDGWRNYVGTDTRWYSWMFRRAPGFFDVVAGKLVTSSANSSDPHSLGVTPEMMITKERTITGNWFVWHKDLPIGGDGRKQVMMLNAANAAFDQSTASPINPFASLPSETSFVHRVNAGSAQIAYLFATLPGVSKVGSYTGNGSSQTINCGFTSGARFVLIKRADSTGDWYVWDTARGIVAANDPHLSLNTTAAEVTTDDSIDPDSSGFIVSQVSATNINVSSASYIYLAIA